MDTMNERERFLRTLLGNGADRFPFYDLEPAEETLDRWHKEGLSKNTSVAETFGLEAHYSVGLTLRSAPFFRMAPDLLNDPSAFDRHYDVDDPARYEKDYVERAGRLSEAGRVLYVEASGGGLLQKLGVGDWKSFHDACSALILEPRLVENLLNRTSDFYCICLERVLSQVGVDYASFYEPIASNHGPVISPDMFKRYAVPVYKETISVLEKYDVPLRVFCTTGGDVTSLLGPLIDVGINALWISNIGVASMEYAALRRHFGDHISLIGGIDTGVLRGDEKGLRSEVESTVLPLLEKGRYLPCLDDRPRVDISFPKYRLFRNILEEIAQRG